VEAGDAVFMLVVACDHVLSFDGTLRLGTLPLGRVACDLLQVIGDESPANVMTSVWLVSGISILRSGVCLAHFGNCNSTPLVLCHQGSTSMCYSLRSIVLFANMDVFRHILVVDISVLAKSIIGQREYQNRIVQIATNVIRSPFVR
jgi:hypothetical protein